MGQSGQVVVAPAQTAGPVVPDLLSNTRGNTNAQAAASCSSGFCVGRYPCTALSRQHVKFATSAMPAVPTVPAQTGSLNNLQPCSSSNRNEASGLNAAHSPYTFVQTTPISYDPSITATLPGISSVNVAYKGSGSDVGGIVKPNKKCVMCSNEGKYRYKSCDGGLACLLCLNFFGLNCLMMKVVSDASRYLDVAI